MAAAVYEIQKSRGIFKYMATYVLLPLWALLTIYPFVWVIVSSLKSNDEIFSNPFGLPSVWKFENYVTAWKTAQIGLNFMNSFIISISSVGIILVLGSMAAYIIARVYRSLGLYTYFTVGIMIPIQAILIPSFILMKDIGLMNSRLSLIILYVVNNLSLGIFILVGFLKGLPYELENAARIDGCSMTRTFFNIIFPISKPGLATVAVLSFLNSWNEYLFASVLITDPKLKTLTQGIFSLRGQHFTDYSMLSAGLVIAIVPVVIMYLIFQEQIIKGMTAGAVKG